MSDPALARLMEKFVCVRLVQMGGVDLSLFQFDPFLSWAVMFLNADKTVYGRFGTAHPQAKRSKKDSNTNHTLAGLRAALTKALEIHAGYEAEPKTWKPRLAGKTGAPPPWRHAEQTPAAKKYKRLKRIEGAETTGCVHCHEVLRTQIDSYLMKRRRIPDDMLWVYPHPEIVGLTLDRDHAARVVSVAADSPAAQAGLRAGDEVVSLDGQPLLSIADVQWVLHRFGDGGSLPITFLRAGTPTRTALQLPDGWRRTGDFCWRYRMAGYAMWLWGGVTLADDARGVRVARRSPGWFKKPNRQARTALQPGDLIVEVDGRGGWTRSTYLAYLMREKRLGSTVKLVVERGGARIDVSFRIPKVQPEVLGH